LIQEEANMSIAQIGMARVSTTASSQTFAQLVAGDNVVGGMTDVPQNLAALLMLPIAGSANINLGAAASADSPGIPNVPFILFVDWATFGALQFIGSSGIFDLIFFGGFATGKLVGMARVTFSAESQTFAALQTGGNAVGTPLGSLPQDLANVLFVPVSGAANWNAGDTASPDTPSMPAAPFTSCIDLPNFEALQFVGDGAVADMFFSDGDDPYSDGTLAGQISGCIGGTIHLRDIAR
jgi:hypothetical protein